MINSKQKMWIRKRKANKLLSRPLAVLSSLSSLRLSAVFTATFKPSTTSLLTDRGCEGDSADIKTQTPEQTEIFPSRATGARSSSVQTDEEEEEEVEFGRRPPHPLGGWRGDEGGEVRRGSGSDTMSNGQRLILLPDTRRGSNSV